MRTLRTPGLTLLVLFLFANIAVAQTEPSTMESSRNCGGFAPILEAAAPGQKSPWPTFQHDARHTGVGETLAPRQFKEKWRIFTGSGNDNSPVLGAAGAVVFIIGGQTLYAIDGAKGKAIWKKPISGTITVSTPAISPNGKTVYAGGDKVYAFDAMTGEQKWKMPISGDASSPTLSANGDTVYVGGGDKNVFALKSADGSEIWEAKTGAVAQGQAPALSPDGKFAYVYSKNPDPLTGGGLVYALRADSGQEFWKSGIIGNGGGSPTVTPDGKCVLVGSNDKHVYAYSAMNGGALWIFDKPQGSVFSTPAIVGAGLSTLFVFGSDDKNVYAVNILGAQVWKTPTGGLVRPSVTVKVDQRAVYIGSFDSNLYELEALTGGVRRMFRAKGSVLSSAPLGPVLPAAADNSGVLYFVDANGILYAVE